MDKLFKGIYFAGMVVEVIARTPYGLRRRRGSKTDQRVTRAERGVLAGLYLAGLPPVIYSLTGWLDFANYRWSPVAKARGGSIGTLFLGAAIWLFWRSHHDLGSNWSPSLEIDARQTLVTEGVYGRIRHPMYASQLVWGIGQALLLQNWIAGWAGLVAFLPLYLVRVPREEQMMLDHFGEEYQAYSDRTGRIVPRWRG